MTGSNGKAVRFRPQPKTDEEADLMLAAYSLALDEGLTETEAETASDVALLNHRGVPVPEEPPGPTPAEVSSEDEPTRVPLVSLAASLSTPETPTEYVVGGLLNEGGTSCLSGPFKGGKSTLLRIGCVAIAAGIPFLGRDSRPMNVGYVSLEEEKGGVKEHFRLLTDLAGDPAILERIFFEVGDQWLPGKLDDKIDLIYETITAFNLGFLVIGPLQDFFGFRNINDYSEVKPALRAFTNKVSRSTGCHVCFDHHNNKYGTGRGAFLGSVAIGGGVDQLLTLTVVEDDKGQVLGRGLTTWQRYGESMLNLLGLDFAPNQLETSLGPPPERLRDQAGLQQLAIRMTALCHSWTEAKTIADEIGGRSETRIAALAWAVDQGMLIKRNRKGRGGGFEYLDRAKADDADLEGTTSGSSSEE